jgi:hypothetical protein
MKINFRNADVTLAKDQVLEVEAGNRGFVKATAGTVWITHAGDLADHILAEGKTHTFDSDRETLISALGPATIHIEQCPAREAVDESAEANEDDIELNAIYGNTGIAALGMLSAG